MKAERTISDLHLHLWPGGVNRVGYHAPDIMKPFDCGSGWTEESIEIRDDNPDDPTVKTWTYAFSIAFKGQSTFYIDDLSIEAENN